MVKPVYYGPKRTTNKNNPNKGLTAVQKMDLQAYTATQNFAASASQVANIPALPPGPAGAVVAPATKLPAPQGVEEQQHQYTFYILLLQLVSEDNSIYEQMYQILYCKHLKRFQRPALSADKKIHYEDIDYVQEMVFVKQMMITLNYYVFHNV